MILIVGTITVWQFQYRETGRTYWSDRPLKEWGDPNFSPPSQAPKWHDEGYLSYPSGEGFRTVSSRSWLADGGEFVKLRLRHRSPEGLKDPGPGKGPPILVQVVGYTRENRPLIKSAIMIAASAPGKTWQTLELVGQVPKEATTLRLMVISRSDGGDYQISELDAVQVERPHWATVLLIALAGGWLTWIYLALRRHRKEFSRPQATTVFATLWIYSWALLLVFPRPLEHPRPLLQTFDTAKASPSVQAQEWPTPDTPTTPNTTPNTTPDTTPNTTPDTTPDTTPASPTISNTPPIPDTSTTSATPPIPETSAKDEIVPKPAPKSLPPAPEKSSPVIRLVQWFKSLKGGRFLLHFGVMGSFTGVLLLLMPFKQAWPAIASIAIGAELIPWILVGTTDLDDLWDLLAYALATGIAYLIVRRLRRFTD